MVREWCDRMIKLHYGLLIMFNTGSKKRETDKPGEAGVG